MDYVLHKGDRGHDSTETVSSVGRRGAEKAGRGPRLRGPWPVGQSRGGFWKLPERAERERGSRAAHQGRMPPAEAAHPSQPPVAGMLLLPSRRGRVSGAASVLPQAKRKSYISRLSRMSSFRAQGWNPITAVWAHWLSQPIRPPLAAGMSLINFFLRETEIIIT